EHRPLLRSCLRLAPTAFCTLLTTLSRIGSGSRLVRSHCHQRCGPPKDRLLQCTTAVPFVNLHSRKLAWTRQDMPMPLLRRRAEYERQSLVHKATAARQILRALTHALERIRQGSFGECAQCSSNIGPKRLEAILWARYCVKCQEAREQD